jgi:hypothetical protein
MHIKQYVRNLGDINFLYFKIPFDERARGKLKMLFGRNSPVKIKS